MIEHLIVWACLAASCKTYQPIAIMYVFDTPQEVRPYCKQYDNPEMGGIAYSCTTWYNHDWSNTFIYYWPDIEKFQMGNDLCHRSVLNHEIHRAMYHDSSVMVGGCNH